jgi:hypothetical protein
MLATCYHKIVELFHHTKKQNVVIQNLKQSGPNKDNEIQSIEYFFLLQF